MAWSRLQSASHTVSSGNGTVAFATANLTAGTKIICAICVSNSSGGVEPVTAIKDGAGNALTKLVSVVLTGSVFVEVWAMDTPAGDAGIKPTLTSTVSTNFGVTMLAQEVSGLLAGNTTAMIDGVGGQNHGTASPATAGTYLTTAANEYLLGIYGDPGDGVTVSNATGYMADTANVNASGFATLFADYKNSTSGPETASWTLSGTAVDGWQTILVAFKLAAGGTAHTATASLTVTPSFTAHAVRGHFRAAALTVPPSFTAHAVRGHSRPASLTVTPAFTAHAVRGHFRTAALTVQPAFTAARVRAAFRTAALGVPPSFTATRVRGHSRTGSLAVSPVLAGTPARGRFRSGLLTAQPGFSTARVHGQVRAGALAVVPAFSTSRVTSHVRSGALAVQPQFRASGTRPSSVILFETGAPVPRWNAGGPLSRWEAGNALRPVWNAGGPLSRWHTEAPLPRWISGGARK